MAVRWLDIQAREAYAGGVAFGAAGAYERLDGTIHFAVDPRHAANTRIVDLARAPHDDEGRVRFEADFCLLQPVDPGRGRRRLLFELVNRGRRNVPQNFNQAPAAPPAAAIDPGDGFLMRHGWTVAWCGWQWDVIRNPSLMGLAAPVAMEDGRAIAGQVVCQFQTDVPARDHLLADRQHHPYAAADVGDPSALMMVREWPDAPAETIPRHRWRFARDAGGRPEPTDTHVWLDDGFEPGRIYEVVYRTRTCPVVGTGLLAVRDCVSFLRHGAAAEGNPAADRLDRAYLFGRSQTGRFQRHFVYEGLNLDERGRPVFDGLMPVVAGARRGEFNQRFGQPSMLFAVGFPHLPPFANDDQTDPATGHTDGLLRRQRGLGGVPKILQINTAVEYWRGDCSLLHTDMAGTRDVEPPPEVRTYHLASTQHTFGVVPLTDTGPEGWRGAHGFNALDYSPVLRAALVNLDQWAGEGVPPPPSEFPRLGDGTAVDRRSVIEAFRAFPGVTLPMPERLVVARRVDLGPEADRGVGRYPVRLGDPYPIFVSAVDTDGNEVAGIRLPEVAVPLATYAGWNPRHPVTGGRGQILIQYGSTLPFPATVAERRASGDPRASVAERYRDRDDYLARVRVAAAALVARRHLLPDDVEIVIRRAAERYDVFSRAR